MNVIPFKKKDKKELYLIKVSNEIDELFLKYMTDPHLEYKEFVGLLAHRFGGLLKLGTEKKDLWELCQKIIKKQGVL